jgi:hypothetical protein
MKEEILMKGDSSLRKHQVTERDKKGLLLIGRFGFLSPDQVTRYVYGGSKWVARRRLRLLQRDDLIAKKPTFKRQSVITITSKGARLAGIPAIKPAKIGTSALATLGHSLALVDIAQHLVSQSVTIEFETERELLKKFKGQAALRQRVGRIPDLSFVDSTAQRWAVEYDLTAKRTTEYRRLLLGYASNPEFDRVLWLVYSETVKRRLHQLVKSLHLDDVAVVGIWRASQR